MIKEIQNQWLSDKYPMFYLRTGHHFGRGNPDRRSGWLIMKPDPKQADIIYIANGSWNDSSMYNKWELDRFVAQRHNLEIRRDIKVTGKDKMIKVSLRVC